MKAGDAIVIRPLGQADVRQYRALRLESLRNFQFAHGPDYEDALAQPLAWHAERLLATRLIDHARSLGTIRQLKLALVEGNVPARRLYDSLGFRQFGLEPDAVLHEGRYCATQHLQLSLVSSHPNEQPIS